VCTQLIDYASLQNLYIILQALPAGGNMSQGSGRDEVPNTAADVRRLASRVRRLMGELIFDADRDQLRELAEELEARASAMEAAQGKGARC
jgi:hypothetical protein